MSKNKMHVENAQELHFLRKKNSGLPHNLAKGYEMKNTNVNDINGINDVNDVIDLNKKSI
jgi:hypothetical protein